jgi:hypothetical protein
MPHFDDHPEPRRINTPAGSTIEPDRAGGYRICDARHHCRRAGSLWEALQFVQWAEVHHQPLDSPQVPFR